MPNFDAAVGGDKSQNNTGEITMATTKRTSARTATDIFGQTIRLLNTKLTSLNGLNSLTYEEVRDAVENNRKAVWTTLKGYGTRDRSFGQLSREDVHYYSDPNQFGDTDRFTPAIIGQSYFRIGCHIFTLAMFNRILRAAGVRTTKPQTLKTFAATA